LLLLLLLLLLTAAAAKFSRNGRRYCCLMPWLLFLLQLPPLLLLLFLPLCHCLAAHQACLESTKFCGVTNISVTDSFVNASKKTPSAASASVVVTVPTGSWA
jgi:ABC-type sulfate transport system permease component